MKPSLDEKALMRYSICVICWRGGMADVIVNPCVARIYEKIVFCFDGIVTNFYQVVEVTVLTDTSKPTIVLYV